MHEFFMNYLQKDSEPSEDHVFSNTRSQESQKKIVTLLHK